MTNQSTDIPDQAEDQMDTSTVALLTMGAVISFGMSIMTWTATLVQTPDAYKAPILISLVMLTISGWLTGTVVLRILAALKR
ncbi:MAG: hypothetical protein WA082_01090 [Candidatus Moraniibacteriota bacterium]